MKRFGIMLMIILLTMVCACGSREDKASGKPPAPPAKAAKAAPAAPAVSQVEQAKPAYFGSIENATLANNDFRRVLFTGKFNQLVVMCLQPGEEIGREMHPDLDQFFRIEMGDARVVVHDREEHAVKDGDAIIIPAGAYHNIINVSKEKPLKLYTIYSPPNHPDGTVHKTKAEADAAEHH